MIEIFLLLIIAALAVRLRRKKMQGSALDTELKELIADAENTKSAASEIRQYLLDIVNDNRQELEKFSDVRLHQAREMVDRLGPGAFYWMTDIAASLAAGYAARINGVRTNVDEEVLSPATPEAVIKSVVVI
ncbi:MAG: hypothetical protein ACO26Z_05695 [Candidatus Nanopelagicaceae bacterium]|jgi:hypothetical protein